MNTPSYYGTIGIMNAPHLYQGRQTRRGIAGLLTAMFERITDYTRRSSGRRRLACLDAHLREDVGVSEHEAAIESGKPFWRA